MVSLNVCKEYHHI